MCSLPWLSLFHPGLHCGVTDLELFPSPSGNHCPMLLLPLPRLRLSSRLFLSRPVWITAPVFPRGCNVKVVQQVCCAGACVWDGRARIKTKLDEVELPWNFRAFLEFQHSTEVGGSPGRSQPRLQVNVLESCIPQITFLPGLVLLIPPPGRPGPRILGTFIYLCGMKEDSFQELVLSFPIGSQLPNSAASTLSL